MSAGAMVHLRQALCREMGINDLQIVESVAYSMAMVVRAALGLHADQAEIGVVFHDTLPGWIALATARHLINAGSQAHLVQIGHIAAPSPLLCQLKKPLDVLGASFRNWVEMEKRGELPAFLSSCHNLLCGISATDPSFPESARIQFCQTLNEHSVPVHCIEAPLGLNLDDGSATTDTLYASSTLSLGIPYQGLDQGEEFVGRHYLADISLSAGLIELVLQTPFPILFSEQPVIQIFPVREPVAEGQEES